MPEAQAYVLAGGAPDKARRRFQAANAREVEPRFSVSELAETEKKISAGDLLKRWRAQNAGSRIHRALEALKFGAGNHGAEDAAVQYVLGLQEPPLAKWIGQGFSEWGFQVRTASGTIEGQIDLWAKVEGRIYVVDYKTGSESEKEGAFRQLSLYAWALRKFGHHEPVTMIVVYPLLKKTESRPFADALFLHWETEFSGA